MIRFACRDTQKNLTAYINGELERPLEEWISRHLQECPRCQASVQTEKRLNRQLESALAPEPAPEGLRERIMASIAQEARAGRRDMSWGEVMICALSLSLLLCFAVIWLDGPAVYSTLAEWGGFVSRLGSRLSEWEIGGGVVASLSVQWDNTVGTVQSVWNQPDAGMVFFILLFCFIAAGYQWLRLSKWTT
ncbi:anti-sigma factor family protein [Lihuaxuella thermophila]|uniref:Anti-sigma-W factor RsiW n=1 Tax=Lihuaxuella thermophila TaxID=1173111 RepID=A0A1H8G6A4_9BACL|nr:zf-HC2 domain-containing protein [Lihuaxuella thermophila]SEN38808.1 anti-sigma factor, TIGR02949 family [Lihuaxuella thermophila]